MLDGEVLQHPTMPVVKATNMKKNATMKRAIIARPISVDQKSHCHHGKRNTIPFCITFASPAGYEDDDNNMTNP